VNELYKPLHLPLDSWLQGWLPIDGMKTFSNYDADDGFSFAAGFDDGSLDAIERFTRP
jgi:hypothetical protein